MFCANAPFGLLLGQAFLPIYIHHPCVPQGMVWWSFKFLLSETHALARSHSSSALSGTAEPSRRINWGEGTPIRDDFIAGPTVAGSATGLGLSTHTQTHIHRQVGWVGGRVASHTYRQKTRASARSLIFIICNLRAHKQHRRKKRIFESKEAHKTVPNGSPRRAREGVSA